MKKTRGKITRVFNPSRFAKAQVKELVGRAVESDRVHDSLLHYSRRSAVPMSKELLEIHNESCPYTEAADRKTHRPAHDKAIFLTSRFRSGSTALWSAFRLLDDVTAYYEPFNERRFFDFENRGTHVDSTHIGVTDYSAEYDQTSGLKELYNEDWATRELFMGENAWNPNMRRFIDRIIECSFNRPVMQFNRIDFRLPWIRKQFPDAELVHLYRHPREQWCSFLIDIHEFPRDVPPDKFRYRFYLDLWARDLQHVMPFLRMDFIDHPYQLFYYIWKMSYLFGKKYATQSICYEDLSTSPFETLSSLLRLLNMDLANVEQMSSVIQAPREDRWPQYAEAEWFASQERHCEAVLTDFLGASNVKDTDNFL